MDFSLRTYNDLLNTLLHHSFSLQSFGAFLKDPEIRTVVLRHDVDLQPLNAVKTAQIEHNLGIRGSYYFRTVPQSYDEKIIQEIYSLGHEVGYHYEDVSSTANEQRVGGCRLREEEFIKSALNRFKQNLARMRDIVPVSTICMHGSPMSRWDSRLLWKYYDYKDFGIIGEPYFDINFDEVMYLTDTGRRWDGEAVSVRDKAQGSGIRNPNENLFKDWKVKPSHNSINRPHFPKFHSTFDIIKAAEEDKLPDKIMMTFHPQRWTDRPFPWIKELVWQNVKNAGKYFFIKFSS